MRKAVLVVGILLMVVAVAWGAYGVFVLSRNPSPPAFLPQPPPVPPNNAYGELVECVTGVKEAGKVDAIATLPNFGTLAQKQEVVAVNRDILQRVRAVLDKPTYVDRQEYQTGDPTMYDYRRLARLLIAQAKVFEQQGDWGKAMDTYLDAIAFFEKVIHGGNSLQQVYHLVAMMELFPAIPSLLPRVSAQDAQRGARRLEQLLANEYPLEKLLEQDFRVSLTGWQRTVRAQAMRGFRLDLPKSDLERQMLYLPKAPLSQAAKQYVQQWLEQARQPYPSQVTVPYPPALEKVAAGLVVRQPDEVDLMIARHTYTRTRLRLLYTALLLEAYRKARGRYPASLNELGNSPYLTDPFSSKPFVYRSQGQRYVLYSVGPNSIDDGGMPFPEGRLTRNQSGDLGLMPFLPQRPS
jgi:hypothetical protein